MTMLNRTSLATDHRAQSPGRVAIAHLRRRPLAVACFVALILYFAVAAVSYVQVPSILQPADEENAERSQWIGDWFEAKAMQQYLDPREVPLDFVKPRVEPLDLSGVLNEQTGQPAYPDELLATWEPPPTVDLLLGTDVHGRSVLWRTLYGARMSLTVALGATILSVLIGTTLGAIAGYLGGLIDVIITWLFTTVASIPRILLILALAYALRNREIPINLYFHRWTFELEGPLMLILAMGLTTWVGFCRVIRGEIMKQKSMDYESAARALGASRRRILIRHLLPNAFYLVIIQVSLVFPLFIHLEVILSYLGLGATEGVSWGMMINDSLQEMIRTPPVWWQLVAATTAIFGISLALNLFGDALRDALDPRLQGRSQT